MGDGLSEFVYAPTMGDLYDVRMHCLPLTNTLLKSTCTHVRMRSSVTNCSTFLIKNR